MEYSQPIKAIDSVILLIGLSNGSVWSVDTRTNSFLNSIAISDSLVMSIVCEDSWVIASCEN